MDTSAMLGNFISPDLTASKPSPSNTVCQKPDRLKRCVLD